MSQQLLQTGTRTLLTRAEVRRLFRVNEATIDHWSAKGRIRPVGRLPSHPPDRPRYEDVFVVFDPELLRRLERRIAEIDDLELAVHSLPPAERGQVLWSLLQRAREEAAELDRLLPPRRRRRRREADRGLDEEERALLVQGARRRERRRRRDRSAPKDTAHAAVECAERILSEVHEVAMSLLAEAQRAAEPEPPVDEAPAFSGPDVIELDPFDGGGLEATGAAAPGEYELPLPHVELSGPDVVLLAEHEQASAGPDVASSPSNLAFSPAVDPPSEATDDDGPREIDLDVLPDDGPVILDEEDAFGPGKVTAAARALGSQPVSADAAPGPYRPSRPGADGVRGLEVLDDLDETLQTVDDDPLLGGRSSPQDASADRRTGSASAVLGESTDASDSMFDEADDVDEFEILEDDDVDDEPPNGAGEVDPSAPAGSLDEALERVFTDPEGSAEHEHEAPIEEAPVQDEVVEDDAAEEARAEEDADPVSSDPDLAIDESARDASRPDVEEPLGDEGPAGAPSAEASEDARLDAVDETPAEALPGADDVADEGPLEETEAEGSVPDAERHAEATPAASAAKTEETETVETETFFGPPPPACALEIDPDGETAEHPELGATSPAGAGPRPSAEPIPWQALEEKLDVIERRIRAVAAQPVGSPSHGTWETHAHRVFGAVLVVAILIWAAVAWITTGDPRELILRVVLANLAAAATLLLAPAE